MQPPIRIGLDCVVPSENTLCELIAPEYNYYNGQKVVIVFNPIVHIDPFSPNGYVSNVDMLISGDGLDARLIELMGDRVVNIARLDKTEAMVKLFVAAKGTDIEAMLPLRWHRSHLSQFEANDIPSWVKRCVVKEEGGGSGTPQAIVPLDLVETFVTSHSDYPQTELEEAFPDCIFFFENDEPDPEKMGLMQTTWAAYPYVEGVTNEFRIIRAGHLRMMYERSTHTDKGVQRVKVSGKHLATNKMFHDDYHLERSGKTHFSPTVGWDSMFVKVNQLFDRLGFDWGSIDVYVRVNEQGETVIGIFEYCPQFGTRLMRHSDKRELAKTFIETIAHRYLEEILPKEKRNDRTNGTAQ